MSAEIIKNEPHMNDHTTPKCHLEMDPVQSSCGPHKHETEPQQPSNLQGSITSLETRSYMEQSDVQPLTGAHLCRYEDCVKFHKPQKPDKKSPESPWSPLKNAFLYLVIGLLILWIIVYTVLSQMKLL